MRKISFVTKENAENVKKVMLYESPDGTYLFGYDTVYDIAGLFDNWYEELSDAELACKENYDIEKDDWIIISDPQEFCQHDLIMPVRVKGREVGKPLWGNREILLDGEWKDYNLDFDKDQSLVGMTGNERLLFCGLLYEFEQAKNQDKIKAKKILEALKFDEESIEKILL